MLGRKNNSPAGATALSASPVNLSKGSASDATAASASTPSATTTTGRSTAGKAHSTSKPAQPHSAVQHNPRPGAKNRPTPRRKDQEAARRQPLVVTDRKAAKEADKRRARGARLAQREAAKRGDDSALPARDRGPEKRYIRDRVDARLCVGEIAMPLMLVALVTFVIPNRAVQFYGLLVVWLLVFAGFIDCFFLWRNIKKGLIAKFGSVPRGGPSYALSRCFQMRRLRFPKPQVKRGDDVA